MIVERPTGRDNRILYCVIVQGKGPPTRYHQTREKACDEARRLCLKNSAPVRVMAVSDAFFPRGKKGVYSADFLEGNWWTE